MAQEWRPLKIGGGGWLVGLDIAADGTRVARADVYGAYKNVTGGLAQIVTATSMPAADVDLNNAFGVYEIRIAPSKTSCFYMVYNGYVYRTVDRASSWVRTAFPRAADSNANGPYRMYGPKLAIDPVNPSVVLVATPAGGVWMTINAGASWTPLATLGTTTGAGFAIAFDRSSAVVGGRTQGIYVARAGQGIYRSTDGGATWSLAGGPTTFGRIVVAQDGTLYVTPYNRTNYLHMCTPAGEWTAVLVGNDPNHWAFAVAVDPANANRIAVVCDNGALTLSTDHGATWSGFRNWTCTATDIPWLAATSVWYMAAGEIVFKPNESNALYFAAGVGVWRCVPGSSVTAWSSRTNGVEELVANAIVAPAGGVPVVASWDRPAFRIADPEQYATKQTMGVPTEITHGWALDYCPALPNFLVGLFNTWGRDRSGYSTDGGATWTSFATKPPHVTNSNNRIAGGIAVSSPTNILWFPSNNCPGYYTLDGGATWTETQMAGVSNSCATETGWGSNYVFKRHIVAADRVLAGTFYAYNYLKGVFRTTDGGTSWSQVSGVLNGGSKYNAKLRAVPGAPGTLLFASGMGSTEKLAKPGTYGLLRSTDGGATWAAIPGVVNVYDFGFGAPSAGGSTPTLFVVGFVNGSYGVWCSVDNGATWTSMGRWPLNLIDTISCLSGDMARFGRVYVGFNGSGYAYRDL